MKLHEDKKAMEALISNISGRTKIRRDVLEKDYYVTLVLEELSRKKIKIIHILRVGLHYIRL